jgi:hypothetical protein
VITELAFSLDCLFKSNQSASISKSIQAQISETIDLLVGKNLKERKELEKTFKDLNSIRSSVAQGTRKDRMDEY